MQLVFAIIAALTIVSAVAAMSLRHLVHCALCLAMTFAGLAVMYLQLDAQFIGFAQILVYIGAVAILIVFAILLTRGGSETPSRGLSSSWLVGLATAVIVFIVLAGVICSSSVATGHALPDKPQPTVQQIGTQLMTSFVLPLQAVGLLLTVSTIGAVILAMKEKKSTTPRGLTMKAVTPATTAGGHGSDAPAHH